MSRARTQRLETEARVSRSRLGQGLRIKPVSEAFCDRASLAGIEPVGFRVKSDLRNHQAIVQPRLYDSLMVTHITLKGRGRAEQRKTEVGLGSLFAIFLGL